MKKRPFIHEDFLLENEWARRLYHGYAEALPIIDYHCHLPPAQIANDHRYRNITELWLGGDHYKWRAMRTNGVPERFCTGDATDREKFDQWAGTMPYLLRNPLFHWTHLELTRYFGVHDVLGPSTAEAIWTACNQRLAEPGSTARGFMRQSKVVLVCTTDDPCDDLAHHKAVAADKGFPIKVLPTWRPDKGMAVEQPEAFNAWVDRLAAAAGMEIRTFDDYLGALRKRQQAFHDAGCRLSDHGLETAYAEDYTQAGVDADFRALRGGRVLDAAAQLRFKSAMLVEFGRLDHEFGWTQQYHLGALRNNNSRLFAKLGPDTGFDSIGDFEVARPLSRLLDRMDRDDRLPRTILYNLNPRDNELMVTMCGNFQDGSVAGKIQHGSGWWFLDQKDGMERQIENLSQLGLLSRFVGMVTDSRSFISYPRHEYFRRILCNILGRDMAAGLIPADEAWVGGMVRDIGYRNAARFFGFDLPVEP